jgi:hypothetical protein
MAYLRNSKPIEKHPLIRSNNRWLLLILLVAVLLRVGVAFAFGDTITETRGGTFDQISYDALAQRVAAGHGRRSFQS